MLKLNAMLKNMFIPSSTPASDLDPKLTEGYLNLERLRNERIFDADVIMRGNIETVRESREYNMRASSYNTDENIATKKVMDENTRRYKATVTDILSRRDRV